MTREEARASIKKHLDLMYPYNTPKDVLKVAYEALEQPQIVRCKDCAYRNDPKKCILAKYISMLPNREMAILIDTSEWYCADGKPKDGDSDG